MGLIATLMPLLNTILGFIPDPVQRAQSLQTLMGALQQWDSQQVEVNKIEAASSNWIASSWRPLIGLACAVTIWMSYIVAPLMTWGFTLAHLPIPPMPKFDANMMELVYAMLGMGGLRTFEKLKGVTK